MFHQELGVIHSNYLNSKYQDVRANVFSQRVINCWNHLPVEVVTAPTLSRGVTLFTHMILEFLFFCCNVF